MIWYSDTNPNDAAVSGKNIVKSLFSETPDPGFSQWLGIQMKAEAFNDGSTLFGMYM